MGQRFHRTDEASFFGGLVYDRVIPQNHALRVLKGMVAWEPVSQQMLAYYKGGAEYGAPPYDPSQLLRMLFLSYLYDQSERQTEELVNYNLAAKFFVGLAVDERAPDHSTLSVFKGRMLQKDGGEAFRVLFDSVLQLAQAKGVELGRVQVLDSVHVVADVNTEKDGRRQKKGKEPRDPDAAWGAKGRKKVKAKEEGTGKQEEKLVKEYFHGYKLHVSLNAQSGLVTAATFSSGEAYDGHQLPSLVRQDEGRGVGAEVYAADRGYDDGENHAFLEAMGKKSALKLNRYRTEKKDANKEKWIALKADPDYRAGLGERYRVEQKFGEGKERHGLRRCRYLGLMRFKIQGYLTLMVMNLKRLVKLVGGLKGSLVKRRRAPRVSPIGVGA